MRVCINQWFPLVEVQLSTGIGVLPHHNPVRLNPYKWRLGFGEDHLLQCEIYAPSAISLPLFPGLAAEDQKRVAQEVRGLLS